MLFNLLTEVTSGSESAPSGGGNYTMLIMIGLLVVIMVIMMFTSSRANKKRQKEAEEKLNGMRVGDRVKTIGGICGIVVEINNDENTFVLETGKGNTGSFVKFDKVAVYQTSHPEDEKVEEPVKTEEPAEETPVEAVEETTAETTEQAE